MGDGSRHLRMARLAIAGVTSRTAGVPPAIPEMRAFHGISLIAVRPSRRPLAASG
jgi:hypothetical protein